MDQTKVHVKFLLACISEIATFIAWKCNILFENIYSSRTNSNKQVPNDETKQAEASKLLIKCWKE